MVYKRSGGKNNMIADNLAIVLYTSTKGHFGYKDCYKHTVERMLKEIPFLIVMKRWLISSIQKKMARSNW
jgi:hypothetical protein